MIKPDGTGDTSLLTLPANYDPVAPHPTQNEFVFAYSTNPQAANPSFGIFKSSTVNIAGAIRLTPSNYFEVASLQYTPDGSQIVFTAAITDGDFNLYRMNSDGTGLTQLDDADFTGAHISFDGTKIVYTKINGSFGDIYSRLLSAGPGAGGATQLTSDGNDDFGAQWSKNGSNIAFVSDRNGNYELFKMTAAGSSETRLTITPDDSELGPSWGPTDTEIGYVVISSTVANTGIYKISSSGGSSSAIRLLPNVGGGIFWTPGTNRSVAGGGNWAGYKRRIGWRGRR